MERELLFDAVRDEQGDLFLEVTGTDIAIYMSTDFWNQIIERFQRSTTTDAAFSEGHLARKNEVIEILKRGVGKQELEEKESEQEP